MYRIIAHLDMDAFFASVEERQTPRFLGKPIAVGSDPKHGRGRGVVSTANYKAREYGIHSAMPITKAWQLSQFAKSQGKDEVIFLPVDFELYGQVSANVEKIIRSVIGQATALEQASVDEFYVDMSFAGTFEKAEALCKKIKEAIRAQERVTCSIGVGPNKLIAKIAAGFKKPDGLHVVWPEEAEAFLEPMAATAIPGVGPKTGAMLQARGIETVADLKKLSFEQLHELMGKWGDELYQKIRGRDESPVAAFHELKSIGEQNTFFQDTFDILFISDQLQAYAARVFERFLKSGFTHFKTISITVRFTGFETFSSAKSFRPPMGVADKKKFQFEALKLLLPFLDRRKNPTLKKIRLIGVRIENLSGKSVASD